MLANRILTFALFMWSILEKAKFVIKIDMVNPIPPKAAAPNNCNFEILEGIEAIFSLLPK